MTRSTTIRCTAIRAALLLAAATAVQCGGDPGTGTSGGSDPAGNTATQSFQSTVGLAALTPPAGARTAPRRPDEMLVTFRSGVSDTTARGRVAVAGHRVVQKLQLLRNPSSSLNRVYLLQVPAGTDLDAALQAMRLDPDVEAAQPNFIYTASSVPNDAYFSLQWGQNNAGGNPTQVFGLPGADPFVAGSDIAANAARDVYGSLAPATVVVGVIDSGVDYTHPDLAARIWSNPGEIAGNGIDDDANGFVDDVRGWDFKNNDNNPMDDNAHGTHCSGVIGAIENNGIGVAGTAPNARIMPLKFLGADGSGATADAVSAVNYGVDNGAQVLSNSWGGGPLDPVMQTAITDAMNAGVLFVAAAGNDASNTDVTASYPAGYAVANVVSVAAATPWRDMADFSNYGFNTVDIAAPGDQVVSTVPAGIDTGVPDASYQIAMDLGFAARVPWSGTSMATPAVSGAAALVYGLGSSLWPGTWATFTPVQKVQAVRDRLLSRAERWPSLSGLMGSEGHLSLANLVKTDAIAPSNAGSFAPLAVGVDFVTLGFTAPGDDGATGRANYYDLRVVQGTTLTFASAPRVLGEWTPRDPGTAESITLTGLAPATQYVAGLQVGDHAGNTSGVVQVSFTTAPDPGSPVFSDTMESGTNGWTAQSPWAQITTTSHSATHSWTDSPSGNGKYQNNRNVSLTSPEIVSAGAALRLTYWQRYDIEAGFDFGFVEARTFDGTTWSAWSSVSSVTGTNTTWTKVDVDLPVTGERVQVRFRLQTDGFVTADGWYVDDVSVRGLPGPDQLALDDAFTANDCSGWALAGTWGCESDSLSDSPAANYPLNNRASATLAQPLDFSATERVRVSFNFASFDYESGRDVLSFQYSLDGQSWRNLGSFTGTASAVVPEAFNVDFLAGQPKVWFRFLSKTDYSVVHAGARIDDFAVSVRGLEHCVTNAACNDGIFCNGTETCNVGTGACLPGVPPANDGVSCTADACNETTHAVTHTPNNALCNDGNFCNGTETCNASLGCQAGTAPATDDGVPCTTDSCNEATDSIVHTPVDAACSDGSFCNGAETCNATLGCQSASSPCVGSYCDDTVDACVECLIDAHCDDGLYCNGAETCSAGVCVPGTPPTVDDGVSCTTDSCNETTDSIVHTPVDAACNDGAFCTGTETCNPTLGCQPGSSPCAGSLCDETLNACVECLSAADCDDGTFCNGAEICAAGTCMAGTQACPTGFCDENAAVCTSCTGEQCAVTWTDVVGVNAVGNDLTKTASTGWNAGAASNETIAGDGYMEFTTNTGTDKMAGLSNGNSNQAYQDIDFAIYPNAANKLMVYESGTPHGPLGSYAAGDQFRIESVAGVIQYYRNGSLFYTSQVAPTAPLLVDTSLSSVGAEIGNVTISNAPIFWKSRVGVSVSGTSVTKLAPTALWGNAGASTVSSLVGDGYAEFTTAEANTAKMAGLSRVDANRSYQEIEFALYLTSAGGVQVYESGVSRGTFGSYVAGDVFRVQTAAGLVTYYRNGTILYTSSTTSTSPLVLDTSLFSPSATVNNVVLGTGAAIGWQNVHGVTTTTDGLVKPSGTGWNSGASSHASFSGDGYVEFTANASTDKMAGLSNGDSNQGYQDIDFAIYPSAANNLMVYESGTPYGPFGAYAAGDQFRIESVAGVIQYYRNGSLFYTSHVTPTAPLLFDTSLSTAGAAIGNVKISSAPIFWKSRVGVTVCATGITKAVPTALWGNAGASTVSSLVGDGYAEFTTAEATTAKMAGLSRVDANRSYQEIEFALYLTSTGRVQVYESGLSRGTFGSYVAGDLFRVAAVGGVVTYYRNGAAFYTSVKASVSPLLLDTSLFSPGATINAVMLAAP